MIPEDCSHGEWGVVHAARTDIHRILVEGDDVAID
jgi:hypothetical protein